MKYFFRKKKCKFFAMLFVTVTNTGEKQFKGGMIYFGSWFQSMVSWLHYCGHVIRQNVARMCGGAKLLTAWWPGRRGSQARTCKGMSPATHFLQPPFFLSFSSLLFSLSLSSFLFFWWNWI
jgi:hypothetical protein